MPAYCPNCDRHVDAPGDACPACGTKVLRVREGSLVGQVLDGRYEIQGRIGKGGMGEVFLARQRIIDRVVALKVLRRELTEQPDLVQRFLREARAMGRLSSPYTIRLFDFGITGEGLPYFTMEYLEGEPLSARLEREHRLDVGTAVEMTLQVCESLSEAHAKGILHRDLKPENVFLVTTEGGGWQVRVLDFGIAKILGSDDDGSSTKTGQFVGTPRYIAPEILNGARADARADLYAVGVMLYEMLTGEAAYQGSTALEILTAKMTRTPTHLSALDPEGVLSADLCELVMAAASHDPDLRPASADDLAARLRAVVGKAGAAPGAVAVEPPLPRPPSAAPDPQQAVTRVRLETAVREGSSGPGDKAVPAPTVGEPLARALATDGRRRVVTLFVVAATLVIGAVALWLVVGAHPQPPSPSPSSAIAPKAATEVPRVAPSTQPLPTPPVVPPEPPVSGPASAAMAPTAAPLVPVAPPPAPTAVQAARRPVVPASTGVATKASAPKVERAKDDAAAPGARSEGGGAGLFELKPVERPKGKNPFELKPVGGGSTSP